MTDSGPARTIAGGDTPDGSADPPAVNDLPVWVWIAAPILAVLYPGLLYQWVFGVHAFRTMLYLSTTTILATVTVATWALLHYLAFKRDLRRSTGVTAVLVIAVFSWPPWTAIGEGVANVTRVAFLMDIVPVFVAGGLLWAAVRYADRDRFIVIVDGALIGVLIVLGAGMLPRLVGSSDVSLPAPPPGPKPNVVVLVVDGYARADVLASQYGFDNTAFLGELSDRGFQIRDDAVANYSVTHTSLSSIMAADYPFEEGARSDASMDRMRRLLSGDGTLMHTFDAAGYDTLMFENAWAGSLCGTTPNRCHRTGIVSRSLWSLGQMSPLAVIQRMVMPHPFTAIGLQHIRELGDLLEPDAPEPLFVFAHVTVPHPPTQLDASCDFIVSSDRVGLLLSSADATEAEQDVARARYVEQLQCINDEVIATIDSLIATDEDIEIVVMSDHGPDSQAQFAKDVADWTDGELLERLGVLSAVRMPAQCAQREPARTTINTVRRAIGCAFGTPIAEVEDRNFVAPAAQEVDEPIVDVTDRMDSISGTPGR